MSNVTYTDGMYNEAVKNDYLQQFGEATRKTFARIFKASCAYERGWQRDLFAFDREQLREFLLSLAPAKRRASRLNCSAVSGYIDWAIERGHRETSNPLQGLSADWYDPFVDTSRKQYFTEQELEAMIAQCRNAQDAVLIRLLMEGVGGEGNSELLHLTGSDIHERTNELTLRNADGSVRKLTVSKACIELCRRALEQTSYLRRNGHVSERAKVSIAPLVRNDYVVKSSITQTGHRHNADKHIVHRRLRVLAELFGEPGLIPKNIAYSGMLIAARDLYRRDGKLGKLQYDTICEIFRVSQSASGRRKEYNYYRLKGEFLHLDKVMELYRHELESATQTK